MSRTRLILLAVALFAGIAALLMFLNLQRATPADQAAVAAAPAVETVQVLVVNRDLAAGEVVKAGDVIFTTWPKDAINPNFITEEADPQGPQTFTGAVARVAVNKGEPVTIARLVKPGDKSFLAAIMRPGFRAVALPASAATAAGGFILPGDSVDVLLVREIEVTVGQSTTKRVESQTILEDVRVLAVDQTYRPAGEEEEQTPSAPEVMTLELAPRDAEMLATAGKLGTVQLALRSLNSEENQAMGTQARPGRIMRQNVAAPDLEPTTVRITAYGNVTERTVGE
jgi:pilus assembly protein CpaB